MTPEQAGLLRMAEESLKAARILADKDIAPLDDPLKRGFLEEQIQAGLVPGLAGQRTTRHLPFDIARGKPHKPKGTSRMNDEKDARVEELVRRRS